MAQDDTEHAETLAMIAIAQKGDPRRLLEAIAEVACQLEIKGYTTAEIEGAVAELLGEVEQSLRPRTALRGDETTWACRALKLGQSAHRTPHRGSRCRASTSIWSRMV